MNPSPGMTKKTAGQAMDSIISFEKKPLGERFPVDTTYELICRTKTAFGKERALAQLYTAERVETAVSLDFDQLVCKITQIANLLHSLGIRRGDTVTILLPSLMEKQIALWGSQAVGIANPVNYFLETNLITEIMNEVKSRVLVTLSPGDSLGVAPKVCEIIKQVPTLTHILVVSDSPNGKIDTASYSVLGVPAIDLNQALKKMPGEGLSFNQGACSTDTAIYFHTGGTTGRPKIAMLPHSSVAFVAQIYAEYNSHHGRTSVLNPLPLFHVFGTIAASLAIFLQGRCVVLMTPTGFRNPNVVKNWWHFIERFQVAWFATVPTILAALMQVPLENHNRACLSYINSGSAPLSVDLKNAFAEKFNTEVVSGYGMTESSCLISRCLPGYHSPDDTVGLRIPYTKLVTARIRDRSIEKICSPGEPGVVLVQGPNIFKGYLDPKENNEAWVDGKWFNTGDIGILDKDGFLRLTGRAKDLIIRGGHNIDPLLIEVPLENHPAVSQAVAVGQPDTYAGELPVVYICLKKTCRIKTDDLEKWCRENISERSAIPKRIEIIDAMPLTAVGKISKPHLRNMAAEYAVKNLFKEAGIDASVFAENTPEKGQVIHVGVFSSEDGKKAEQTLKGFPASIEFHMDKARPE